MSFATVSFGSVDVSVDENQQAHYKKMINHHTETLAILKNAKVDLIRIEPVMFAGACQSSGLFVPKPGIDKAYNTGYKTGLFYVFPPNFTNTNLDDYRVFQLSNKENDAATKDLSGFVDGLIKLYETELAEYRKISTGIEK